MWFEQHHHHHQKKFKKTKKKKIAVPCGPESIHLVLSTHSFTPGFRVQRVVQPFLPAVPSMIDNHHQLTALSPTLHTFPTHVGVYTCMLVCLYVCINLVIQSFTYKSMWLLPCGIRHLLSLSTLFPSSILRVLSAIFPLYIYIHWFCFTHSSSLPIFLLLLSFFLFLFNFIL